MCKLPCLLHLFQTFNKIFSMKNYKAISKHAALTKNLLLSLFCFPFLVFSQENHDWNDYSAWEPATEYKKEIVVNQRHPKASDRNPGTKELPLKTISKACAIVKPQERVIIYEGVYREMVVLRNSGLSKNKMISVEAAPGENVVISGSEIIDNVLWERNLILTDAPLDTNKVYSWNKKVWHINVPEEIIKDNYNPFVLKNIEEEDYPLMPWAHLTKNKAPFNLPRVMLFQNGKRMVQLAHYDDLVRIPGSFYIGNHGKEIHIHPYGDIDPNEALFEVATKSHLFKPEKVGYSYIRLAGITFQHCANSFLRTSTGAVTILGGDHWLIEDNIIREINSSGLEFGYYAFEFKDENPLNIQPRQDEEKGSVIVRNNTIHNCGTAGMRSYSVINGRIENNLIYDCGWQNAENYWECGGMKLLRTRNTLVRDNHIHHIQGGNAIWLDWDNRYSRVTGNLIHDIQTIQGGIFIEASQFPNLIDNNFIWDVNGNGIYLNDTDESLVAHNLIANTTGSIIHAVVATERILNGRKLTAENNRIFNNIFVNGGEQMKLESQTNKVNYNLYITSKQPENINLINWQTNGYDKNSIQIKAFISFDPNTKYLLFSTNDPIPKIPVINEVTTDYFGNERTGDRTVAGPFIDINKTQLILFSENVFNE
jgi:alpha-L-arabinofuranosidase